MELRHAQIDSDFEAMKPVIDDEVPTHRSDNMPRENVYNINKV